jgi:hypothetical protein
MLNDKQRSKLEQSIATLTETFPRVWMQMFLGCVREGFTAPQALDLVKTYILAQNPNGIVPPSSSSAEEPEQEDE